MCIFLFFKIVLQSFLNECCLDEMVGSSSEVMEPSQNINLPNGDIKVEDDSLFMLNTDTDTITDTNTITDTDTVKVPTEEMHLLDPNVVVKTEIEEHSEGESDSLERYIIVEEAVEEVTTTYDEHILEICQEDDMDTEQYEDIGYESLSSPEYDYKARYNTPPILTNLFS